MSGTPDAGALTTRVVDDVLGRWTHMEWRPPHLREWVDRFWLFEGRIALRRERTFPSGSLDLILQLEGRYRPGDDPAAGPFPVASVNGVLLGPHIVESPPEPVRVLGIIIHAAGARPLLGGCVPDLTGTTLDLADVLGAEANELVDRCRDATGEEALRRAAGFVERRLARAGNDRAVRWVAGQIAASAGRASIVQLAQRTGISPSTLSRRFRAHTGVTPKRLARIHRFRHTLERLHAEPSRSLSELAYDAGYYDQPHMNGEFRELAGLTPTEYVAALRYPGGPSLAEAV